MDDETGKFSSDPKLTFQHPYPPTKIMFIPDKEGSRPDLLATTGDFLRIWQVSDDGVQLHKLLNNVRPPPAPGVTLAFTSCPSLRAYWPSFFSFTKATVCDCLPALLHEGKRHPYGPCCSLTMASSCEPAWRYLPLDARQRAC